jgi:hypothetical protein
MSINIDLEEVKSYSKEIQAEARKLKKALQELEDFKRAFTENFPGDEILTRLSKTAGEFYKTLHEEIILTKEAILVSTNFVLQKRKEIEQRETELKYAKEKKILSPAAEQDRINEIDLIKKEIEALIELNDQRRQAARNQNLQSEKLKLFSAQVNKQTESIISRFLGVQDRSGSLFSQMFDTISTNQTTLNKFTFSLKEMGVAFKRNFTSLNLMDNLLSKVIQSTYFQVIAFDSAINSFEKATGLVDEYNDSIGDTWQSNLMLGASAENVSKAYQELIQTFGSYSLMAKESKEDLAELVLIQERLGVADQTTVKSLSLLVDGFKMTTDGAREYLGEVRGLAKQMGMPLSSVMNDLIETLPVLAKRGVKATEVFMNLSAQAKALRIDTRELLNVVEGYDTFEDAAGKVGRLNAILGGPYLNTLQLMKAEESERVEILLQTFKASGKVWDAMSAQEMQAVANAAGISDMTTAQKIFNGSLSEYRQLRASASISEEEARERAKDTMSLVETFHAILSDFAVIVQPIASILGAIMGVVRDFVDFIGPVGGLPFAIGALILSFTLLKKLFNGSIFGIFKRIFGKGGVVKEAAETAEKSAGPIGNFFSKVLGKIGEGLKNFFSSMRGVIAGAAEVAASILLVGGAIAIVIAGIGGALWILGKGIAALDEAFSGLSKEQARASMLTDFIKAIPENADQRLSKLASGLDVLSNKFSRMISADQFDQIEKLTDMFSAINAPNLTGKVSYISEVAEVLDKVVNLDGASVKRFETIKDSVVQMYSETSERDDLAAIFEVIAGHGKQIGAMAAAIANSDKTVILKTDDREIGRASIRYQNGLLKPSMDQS